MLEALFLRRSGKVIFGVTRTTNGAALVPGLRVTISQKDPHFPRQDRAARDRDDAFKEMLQ